MATRAADDFDTIRKRLEQIKKEQSTEGPPSNDAAKVTVAEDREPTPSADYGLCYDQHYAPFNLNVKD